MARPLRGGGGIKKKNTFFKTRKNPMAIKLEGRERGVRP